MKTKLLTILTLLTCLIFGNTAFADVEEDVIVVTNVDYTASLTKKSATESSTVSPATGTHTGLSSVFTLQTNGGDDYFDYIITSYIDIEGERVSAFGSDGRVLFAHEVNPPSSAAVNNAKSGVGVSKNVFAYPTTVSATNGFEANFQVGNATYGDCYVVLSNGNEESDITYTIGTSPCPGTYEVGRDESGTYKSTMVITIASK